MAMSILSDNSTETSEVSYGEKIMGVNFNPSGNLKVDKIKALCAELADILNLARKFAEVPGSKKDDGSTEMTDQVSPEVKRMCSIAITELQTAQMWAVKAVTWID